MDISNSNSSPAVYKYGNISANEAQQMERNEKYENCWQDNAADAIHKAFSNMDEFVTNFKQSSLFEES